LKEVTAQGGEKLTPNARETAGHTNAPTPLKAAIAPQSGGTGGNVGGGNNEHRNG
jgi:hypothetical protein